MHDKIPVTLLTGFLGAGKTTLLNRLLHDPAAGRVAVVVNEFGEAGLDHDLIEDAAEDVVLMQSGCICCSIRGDLSRTLVSLLARRVRDELQFDRVVIETTGLADPGPIHHTLMVDRVLAPNYTLDGIVTVVDGALGMSTLDRHAEALAQVAMADRIVLTKRDLTDATMRRNLQARLERLNPGAQPVWADMGAVPAANVFGLGAMRQDIAADDALAWLAAPAADPLAGLSGIALPEAATSAPFETVSHHASDDRIATASIRIETPIPAEVFDFWLDSLIAIKGPDILRIKGIVHLEDIPYPFVFHGVQHIFAPPTPLKSWPKGDTSSRIVVIARDIPKPELDRHLALLLSPPAEKTEAPGMMGQSLETPF
ncbi:CobW family GTP-binding protein [Roseinatronobacter alkalisoli]|uniref:GTP-binding protein n=1 Tax=Roseinatronobacter alkalisoli TaxID=3028235 RepID=A0ABT5T7W8_9RHOB|nr:GTP-binding protein [Roseinatronobacter sp. HJB301]MDD7971212.1 GTP-binding protein [Roseinatronobacter sp. HJB301]